jgi:hypothetical protein
MPEIRINSRPCPHCGHRNVTIEDRICERCGTSLVKAQKRRVVTGSVAGVVALLLAGLFIIQPWSSEDQNWAEKKQKAAKAREEFQTTPAPQKSSPTQEKREEDFIQQPQELPKQQRETKEEEPVYYTEKAEERQRAQQKVSSPQPSSAITSPRPPAELAVNDMSKPPAQFTSDANNSQDYKELVNRAQMLASDLDVTIESINLNEFKNQNFERLAQMLQRPEYQGRQLILIGMAESVGSHFIAKNRAEFAKEVLEEKYNITLPINAFGFGPVSDHPSNTQRLEAWIQ